MLVTHSQVPSPGGYSAEAGGCSSGQPPCIFTPKFGEEVLIYYKLVTINSA